jgi:hypothetical protein
MTVTDFGLGLIVAIGSMITAVLFVGILGAIAAMVMSKTRDAEALEKLEALLDRCLEKMK